MVVTYCNRAIIDRCLASVRSRRGDLAVTVVDNSSSDGTGDHVARRHPDVTLIRNQRNVGFAAAVNQGARHEDGDYLLMVDPDTELDELAIDQLLTLADRFPQAGLYGGRTVDEVGELDPTTCLGRPTLWHAAAFGTGLAAGFGVRLDPDSLGGWRRDDVRTVPVLTATLLLVDTQLWHRLGGFDERFVHYGEDVDLCVRATGLGATPMFTPLARYRHRGGANSTPEGRMIGILRGKATVYSVHLPWPLGGLARFALVAGVALRACEERHRRSNEVWQAAWRRRAGWRKGWHLGKTNQCLRRPNRATAPEENYPGIWCGRCHRQPSSQRVF